ncbi:glycosyltransferase [Acidisoma sp. 7E03]
MSDQVIDVRPVPPSPLPSPLLIHGLDEALPQDLYVGKGLVLRLQGWCYAPSSIVRDLAVLVDDTAQPIAQHSWARPDIFAVECPTSDESGASLMSGFDGFVSFSPVVTERDVTLTLRVTLESGQTIDKQLGQLRLRPGYGASPLSVTWPESGPRVAICMATYNPPPKLFTAQIESLLAQTHGNWICIISDDGTPNEEYDRIRYRLSSDPRFHVFQNPRRL